MGEHADAIFQTGYEGCRAMTRQWLAAMAKAGDVLSGYESVIVTKKDKHGRILATKKTTVPDRPVDKNGSGREFIALATAACTASYVDPNTGEAILAHNLLDSGMVWEILAPVLKKGATFERLKSLAAEPDFKAFCKQLDKWEGVHVKGGPKTYPIMSRAGPAIRRHCDRLDAASARLEKAAA